jgi:hypothetical protein
MASYISYNNIIDILTDIANRHQQINTFYVGENWEIENDADIVYPVFQVYPTLAKLPRNAYGEYKTIQINMNCKVVGLTRQDNENEQDIYSDMLQVSQDIINELSQNPYFQNSNVSILNDISINPLNEFNDDYTNGWEWELSFQLINNNTWCGLPFDPIDGISYNGPVSTGYTYTNLFDCNDLIGCPIIIETEDRLTVLESILFTSNQLLSGTVNYLSGTTYDITPLTYLIQGIVYNVPLATQVVLLTGDTLYDRIDVIYADISGNTGVLIGEPADSPVKPIIDTLTQVELTFVSIPANSSTPAGVTTTLVYDEFTGPPTEWTFTTNAPTKISANATNQVYSGSKSIRLLAATTTNYFEMSASTVFDSTTQNTIQFAIRNNIVWPTGQAIRVNLYSSTGVLIGGTISLINGAYGFSSTNITSWQLINIPISAFAPSTALFSKLRFTVFGSGVNQTNVNIDYIRMITGVPTTAAFPNWRYIKGDLATTIDATTPNNTLTISGGTNIGSRVTGTNTLVIDMDPNIRLTGLTATTISATTYQGLPISNNFYTTGATISNNIAYFNRNDTLSAYTLNLSAFTSNDIYVTGGTYNPVNGTTTLLRNDGGTVVVSGYYTGATEYWTSGSTGLYSIKANNDSALDAIGNYAVAEGGKTIASGDYSHSEGRQTTASGLSSHAEGQETTAIGDYSHSEGRETTAIGNISHAEGYLTTATGEISHAEGQQTTAIGYASHAEGQLTTAIGNYSHTEGFATTAIGYGSHVEGESTIANGYNSHAEGTNTITGTKGFLCDSSIGDIITIATSYGDITNYFNIGDYLFIDDSNFGNDNGSLNVRIININFDGSNTIITIDSIYNTSSNLYLCVTKHNGSFVSSFSYPDIFFGGNNSHAEGQLTTAIGNYSHTEGQGTVASGEASHAEGDSTVAIGNKSHAEGSGTLATGTASHAGGSSTIASGINSFVHGNISQANGNSTIVLGDNITGNTDNTVYVPYLNIKNFTGATAVAGLAIDSNGNVITGFTSNDIYVTGGTYTAGTSTFRNNTGGTFNVTGYPTKTSDLFNDGDDGISHFISLNDLPSNIILYATTAASDIGGYFKLVSSINDPSYNTGSTNVSTGAITTTNQLISSLVTSANIIVGNPGVFNITTIGNISKTAGSGTAEFYFEVWKRTSGGTETLIVTSSNTIPVVNTGYSEFSATGLWNDGDFVTSDRIVLKFYGSRISGGSNPTYKFQFGGNTPVRTLVPIPLAVIPSNYIFTGGTVTGPTNFTGGLTASTMSATTYYGDGSNLTGITIPTAAPAINLFNYYNNI